MRTFLNLNLSKSLVQALLIVNGELFHAVSQTGKFLDRPFRYIQNAMGKCTRPLTSVWYKIIQCEAAAKKPNPDGSAQMPVDDTLLIDFTEIRQFLDLTPRLLDMAASQLVIQCRLDLQHFILPGFQKLCQEHVPFNR